MTRAAEAQRPVSVGAKARADSLARVARGRLARARPRRHDPPPGSRRHDARTRRRWTRRARLGERPARSEVGDSRLGNGRAAAPPGLQRHPLPGKRGGVQGARAHHEPGGEARRGAARLGHAHRRHDPVQRFHQHGDRARRHAAAARPVAGAGRHHRAREHPLRREQPSRRGAQRDHRGGERAALDRARQRRRLQGRLHRRRAVGASTPRTAGLPAATSWSRTITSRPRNSSSSRRT